MSTTNHLRFDHRYYLRAGRYTSYLFENENGKLKQILGDGVYYNGRPIEEFMRNLGPLALATGSGFVPEGFLIALDKIPEKPSTKLDELLEQVLAL